MGINTFPISTASGQSYTYLPFADAGTYTLPTPLTRGVYIFETDTTQASFTLLFRNSTTGYKTSSIFGTIRGGKGFISIPTTVDQIVIPTMTNFPVVLGYYLSSYIQIAAPTFTSFTFTGVSGSNRVGTLAFTPPSGATSIGVIDKLGVVTDLSTTTSPVTNVALTNAIPASSTSNLMIVAKDVNGVWGQGVEGTSGTATSATFYLNATSSRTFISPFTGNADILIVSGGGGSGSRAGEPAYSGGGGAGGMLEFPTQSLVSGTTYTITVGALALNGTQGNASSFVGGALNLATVGGGRGGVGRGSVGASGGSGGGGGNTGGFGNSGITAGGTGTSGQGFAGGSSGSATDANNLSGGGGGGRSGVGAANGGAGGAGLASSYSGSSVTYAQGGHGSSNTTPETANSGNGGNGFYGNPSGYTGYGQAGTVVVRFTY